MNDDELLQLWKLRADADVPAEFADRVMDAVRRAPPRSTRVSLRFMSSPVVRVAACVLACLACLYRMAAVIAVFVAQ